MIRYLLSLIVFLAVMSFATIFSGSTIGVLLNINSFLISGIFPIIFACILFSFREMVLSFSVLLKKEPGKENLLKALNFFKIYGKILWITGIIAVLIITVSMLTNLDDKSGLGVGLHLALITILYCGIITMGITIPYTILIKKKL